MQGAAHTSCPLERRYGEGLFFVVVTLDVGQDVSHILG